ncbi:MAG TPA: type IV secretion system DNA-binding domain-containing protein [Thermoanaerobaculia bacterium]|nr:type IV secretion system DNA-binding domain-containing protein [Thermoanaerobaculia bacterium]
MPPHQHITYFARTTYRNRGKRFGIRREDRRSHMLIIGRTGTGKSTLLRTLVSQDILRGEGFALFDPHGDLIESLLPLIPPARQADLVYLDTPNAARPWFFNPFAGVDPEKKALAAAGMVEVFKKLWPDEWGPRLEHLLRNVVFTLLDTPGATLGDIPRLLSDKTWRKEVVEGVSNEEVRAFWKDEYERYSQAFRAVVAAPLQNKVGAFLTDPLLARILKGERSSFDLREIMDKGKILLVNLAKGKIGEGPASLLGALLVSSLSLVAFGRADVPEEERRDFFVYLDEFHTFATLSLATMLSELRKYRVGLILAHQYFSQLETEIRDAVLGNVGTLISFRVGALDAPLLAREFSPVFDSDDLLSLPNFNIYLKLMIDGEVSRPFSAKTWVS